MLKNYKWMANGEIKKCKKQCVISQLAFQLHIHISHELTSDLSITHRHTQPFSDPLSSPGLSGWASSLVPEETFTHLHLWGRIRRIRTDKVCNKPTYNQSRPDARLKLTASTFNRLWTSMPAMTVLVAVPTVMQNCILYHYCLPISGFYGAGKDNRGRLVNNPSRSTPSALQVPQLHYLPPHFYTECPFCRNPPNLSWLGTGIE